MIDPVCKPCENVGVIRKAHRMTAGGTPICNEHYIATLASKPEIDPRFRVPPPVVTPLKNEREKPMPARKEVDWNATQKDRNAGMTTAALADKYDVSTPTVCAHTVPAAKPNGTKPVAAKPSQAAVPTQKRVVGSGYDAVLGELRAKREQLNVAISAIEALG